MQWNRTGISNTNTSFNNPIISTEFSGFCHAFLCQHFSLLPPFALLAIRKLICFFCISQYLCLILPETLPRPISGPHFAGYSNCAPEPAHGSAAPWVVLDFLAIPAIALFSVFLTVLCLNGRKWSRQLRGWVGNAVDNARNSPQSLSSQPPRPRMSLFYPKL